MTEQNTQTSNENESDERNEAAIALANEFLSRATLGEALSQISLSAVLQLTQSRALQQAKDQVSEMDDNQVAELIQELASNQQQQQQAAPKAQEKEDFQAQETAEQLLDQITSETAQAS